MCGSCIGVGGIHNVMRVNIHIVKYMSNYDKSGDSFDYIYVFKDFDGCYLVEGQDLGKRFRC